MSRGFELERLPLLRTVFTPEAVRERDVVVSGVPAEWTSTAKSIRRAGGRVVGFHSLHAPVAAEHDGLPVMATAEFEGPQAPVVVFGGTPKKLWFTCAPPAPQRCLWTKPLDRRHLRGRYFPELVDQHAGELFEVHDSLADSLSKDTFCSLIKGRVTGDSGYFRISPYPEYEHPSVSARPGDVVLDVGAYDGDTARRYSARVGAEGRVVALEPSHQNYVKLCDNTAREKLDNVLPLCFGAADKHEVASFREGKQAASALAVDGDLKVPLTTLDRLAALLALPRVDIIKLDVEGVERQVLAGAWDVVERYRPMLQVSIYHMPGDLFELPLLLMRRLRDYTYFLGHHSFYHVETDLYCCPRERLV